MLRVLFSPIIKNYMSAFGPAKRSWIWSNFSMQNRTMRLPDGCEHNMCNVYRATRCTTHILHLDSVKQVAAQWVGQQEHGKCTRNLGDAPKTFVQFYTWMWVAWVFAVLGTVHVARCLFMFLQSVFSFGQIKICCCGKIIPNKLCRDCEMLSF